MWQVRFPYGKDKFLVLPEVVYTEEDACFLGDAVLSNPVDYQLLDPATGKSVNAAEYDLLEEYMLVGGE